MSGLILPMQWLPKASQFLLELFYNCYAYILYTITPACVILFSDCQEMVLYSIMKSNIFAIWSEKDIGFDCCEMSIPHYYTV